MYANGSFSLQIHLIETLGQNARFELVLQTFYQLDFRAKKNYNESDLTSDSSLCVSGRQNLDSGLAWSHDSGDDDLAPRTKVWLCTVAGDHMTDQCGRVGKQWLNQDLWQLWLIKLEIFICQNLNYNSSSKRSLGEELEVKQYMNIYR